MPPKLKKQAIDWIFECEDIFSKTGGDLNNKDFLIAIKAATYHLKDNVLRYESLMQRIHDQDPTYRVNDSGRCVPAMGTRRA